MSFTSRRWPIALLAAALVGALVSCTASVSPAQGGTGTRPPNPTPAVTASQELALQILSPEPGQTVTLPMTVRYVMTGLDQAGLSRYQIRMEVSPALTRDFAVEGATGTLQVPTDKFIPGRRDLRFTVVQNGQPVAGPAATVTVPGVTIIGPK